MGFIDNVSVFTKGVGAKAKGNYDIVAMNAQISTLKREINELYTAIGEAYYKEHSESPESAVSDLVNQVSDKANKINKLNTQIEITKTETAAVQLIVPDEKNTESPKFNGRVCKQCGSPISDEDLFCQNCGTRNEVEEVKIATEPDVPNEESQEFHCPGCEAAVAEDDLFCCACGYKLK